MGTNEESIDIESLQTHLLSNEEQQQQQQQQQEMILYDVSFQETEEQFLKYQIAKWIMYSLILVLAWGFGLLMILYLPIRIYVCKKEFRAKKLCLTHDAIIYKENKPVFFPCFGDLKREKYFVLPSVADVIIEQGYIESYFGIFSIRIENNGVRRSTSDDVKIHAVFLPSDFRKVVLTRIASMKNEALHKQVSSSLAAPSGNLILQKLDEVDNSLKKVHALMETKSFH